MESEERGSANTEKGMSDDRSDSEWNGQPKDYIYKRKGEVLEGVREATRGRCKRALFGLLCKK